MNNNIPLPDKFINGGDAITGMPVFGVEHDGMFIHDPYASDCGRFEADPISHGLSKEEADLMVKLNKLIESSAEAAINAACLEVQTKMGIPTGDVAGIFFSDGGLQIAIAGAMRAYIRAECSMKEPRERTAERPTS